jgi:hypothetical protein
MRTGAEFDESSDHLIPMADYREDRQGVISNTGARG